MSCGVDLVPADLSARTPLHCVLRPEGELVPVPGIDSRWDWHNVLTGEPVVFAADDGQPTLALAELLRHCPVALLVAQADLGVA